MLNQTLLAMAAMPQARLRGVIMLIVSSSTTAKSQSGCLGLPVSEASFPGCAANALQSCARNVD
jgi:hypothetical protein